MPNFPGKALVQKTLQKPLIYRETYAQFFKVNTCNKFYKNPRNLRGKKNKISKIL